MAHKAVTMESMAAVVSVWDPAIDQKASNFKEYGKVIFSCNWRDFIKEKVGLQTSVFHIGVIESGALCQIEDECGSTIAGTQLRSAEARWRCFNLGLRDIEHWTDNDELLPKVKRWGVDYVDPKWIQETFVGHLRRVALDVGNLVWLFNQISEDDVKK